MSMEAICRHERLGMLTRRDFGYDQDDDHVWRWLNHHLRLWGEAHPFGVTEVVQ